MPKKKKEPITFTVEPFSEQELKTAVESSEKTLTINYFLFGLVMLFILLTSVFFYINTRNFKLAEDNFSEIKTNNEELLIKQDTTIIELQKINSKIDSSKLESFDLYFKLDRIQSDLNELNKVSKKIDILLLNIKNTKFEYNEKQN